MPALHSLLPLPQVSASLVLAWALSPTSASADGLDFKAQTIDDAIEIGYGIVTGDVDGDGRPDILIADQREIRWYRNPDWQPFVMAKHLSLRDNVCIAARDVDGDRKVEVAVGANWNPGETNDRSESGATFYLVPPEDRTAGWRPVQLPHDPTVHRMHWVRTGVDSFALAVLPLHGIGNRDGAGENTVRLALHHFPEDPSEADAWRTEFVDTGLHKTHNFDVLPGRPDDGLLIAGAEGAAVWMPGRVVIEPNIQECGEIRRLGVLTATIEPMHGNRLSVLDRGTRAVLTESFNQGHALAVGNLDGVGALDIVAGWRNPDASGKVGIVAFHRTNLDEPWKQSTIDDNTMACEDLKLEDLDADGDLDIVAAGRATKNLVIYWNQAQTAP